ncbi:hypothetical protein OSH11_13745 [Kaistia dalseonensis]|uniref:Uncharacterized protein n=1 Tax=Kaistia dalseonensis TaxID=410840 RepID=A0ABU0H8N3_9HYPH|nr:hypothetical protein [Kaistia dalseonensis]MCX5495772.1 hypothetical protein [Kaistia dalseonensis]MDQ0438372.1 hypothetical protein [Kaistia dalseonensis]
MNKPLSERFNGSVAWAALSPAAQAEIGAIALELVAAFHCMEAAGHGPIQTAEDRAADAAVDALDVRLVAAFREHIGDDALLAADGHMRLPSLLGPVCCSCGCSEHDACGLGCSWVEPDLCSACQGGRRHA